VRWVPIIMNIYNRFKRLNVWNKLFVVGATASIIALAIGFWPNHEKQQNIEIYGNLVDSHIIQIQDSNGVEFKKIISGIEEDNKKLESLVQRLTTTEKFLLKREFYRVSNYFPSGYKKETYTIGPTKQSERLKKVFIFINRNFTSQITGKQFKEIDSLLIDIISDEPLLSYAWFYRGLCYSFLRVNRLYSEKIAKIAESNFEKADNIFDLLIEENPEDPYLLLYKGMNLTHLNKGKESVIYLNEALRIEPDIFRKHRFLGIICYWKHIDPEYAKEWESAFKKYWEKD